MIMYRDALVVGVSGQEGYDPPQKETGKRE